MVIIIDYSDALFPIYWSTPMAFSLHAVVQQCVSIANIRIQKIDPRSPG